MMHIKILFFYLILSLLFNANANDKIVETIKMKCKYFTYKIDRENEHVTVYKKEGGNWEEYTQRSKINEKIILPKTETRSEKSIEIDKEGYRLETYTKHSTLKNGVCKKCQIILDFKKLRRKGKGNWKGKPYNLNERCKVI